MLSYIIFYGAIFTVFCGIINLIIELTFSKIKTGLKFKLCEILNYIYVKFTIPVILLCTFLFFIDAINDKKQLLGLVLVASLAVIAFLVDWLIEFLNAKRNLNIETETTQDSRPIFSLMQIYTDIKINNQCAIKNLVEKQNVSRGSMEASINHINNLVDVLINYVTIQTSECRKLLKNKNNCEYIFEEMEKNAIICNNAFTEYEKNLSNINASFQYCMNGLELISDMKNSLKDLFTHNSFTIMHEIDNINSTINSVSIKCGSFKDYVKLLFDKIELFANRIEMIKNALNERNNKDISISIDLENAIGNISQSINFFENALEKIAGINFTYMNKNVFVLTNILKSQIDFDWMDKELKKALL